MTLHNPVLVEIFAEDDGIIAPVTRPISITYNFDAWDFNYLACQMETRDPLGQELLQRFADGELLQYRITGRFGFDTGEIHSVYTHRTGRTGETSIYGRAHQEVFRQVLGFPSPTIDIPQGQTAERKTYTGSELAIMRSVLADNLRDRMGQKIRFQSGDVGNTFTVDFRFDEIFSHLYQDSAEKGGPLWEENGKAIFHLWRDFEKKEYVLEAREAVHHEQALTEQSGLITRAQVTVDRGEASRVIVGGPGEMLDRMFVDLPYPKTQYDAGAGSKARVRAQEYRALENAHEQELEDARDDNLSEKERQAMEKRHAAALAAKKKQMFTDITTASSNRPAVPHPRRRLAAEVFYENTNPDTNVEDPRFDQQYTAMRDAGQGKLDEMGDKGGVGFTIEETDHIHLGGAFQMGDWVRIEVGDGVDLGEIQLKKGLVSFTRDEGYQVQLSDTEIVETPEQEQVDRIVRALRELMTSTRRR